MVVQFFSHMAANSGDHISHIGVKSCLPPWPSPFPVSTACHCDECMHMELPGVGARHGGVAGIVSHGSITQ